MQKKKVGTVLILIMTVGLLGAVAYFSIMLNSQGEQSVTQVKKTKASAQTYHKLLAINVTPIPTGSSGESSSSSTGGAASSSSSSAPSLPTPTTALIAYRPVTPTGAPTAAPLPSATKAPVPSPIPTSVPTAASSLPAQAPPTPTAPLLAYRTLTPTLIPIKETGGGVIPTATRAPTKAPSKPSVIPEKSGTLPETGWVQYSSILFIVAATTVFISFLF